MSDCKYIEEIMFNKITPKELRADIDNGQYKIKNLSYEEISKVNVAYNFMELGHSLNTAIIGNNLEIIKLILEKGGKPLNQEDVREKHYLQLDSSTIGFTHTLHAAVARFIPYSNNFESDEEKDKPVKKNKEHACQIVKLLIENDAEVVNESKYSTLHYAVETRCLELVQLVIDCGARYMEGKRRSIHSPQEKSTEELAKEIENEDIIKLVSQQKEKVKITCSKLMQSFIKNGTTYPLDEGRCIKKKNKILDECMIESLSNQMDKLNHNWRYS